MKTLYLIGSMLMLVAVVLIGCASSSEYIPKGSTKMATFEGTFSGTRFDGNCRIDIFELADGTQRFEGNFEGEENVTVFFRGTVTGNQLTGELSAPADGSLSGTKTTDGGQIKGSYQLTSPDTDNGTWQAARK
jgi:major membrane immunogen (membrane-anchored lipoprotein)